MPMIITDVPKVYGDPEQHPQKETYWGHVNVGGPRSCYDEGTDHWPATNLKLGTGKRVAETMCYAYQKEGHVDVRIARIFNTFGPRMHPDDGRVVSNFIIQVAHSPPRSPLYLSVGRLSRTRISLCMVKVNRRDPSSM